MGTTTDAIIAFGFDLGGAEEGFEAPWYDAEEKWEGDWEEWYADIAGIKRPEHPYESDDKDWKRYTAEKDKLLKNTKVTIDGHCSSEFPMYALVIGASITRASRGYPEKLKPLDKTTDPSWESSIKDFCKLTGLPFKKPSWLLYSYWG